ncbi:class I SAM-dependent methyltransferase [Terriglobus saanensis]|nr:methyltransferase domain-containing protein [Terriglobus saanensis]
MLTQLIEKEKADTCGDQSRRNYLETHKTRFADILRLCRKQVPDASARVLDIGRSELTAHLLNFYRNVHTLGLDPLIDDGGHRETSEMVTVPHITFDLLNSQSVLSWPDCERFDLIVFSEVIEHLCVAPEFVLAALSSLLTERGILICTTPNAAEIGKRVRLVFGQNPYERLRLYSTNPGHVREYTRQELCSIAESVGLRCLQHSYFNWIQDKSGNKLKMGAMKILRAFPSFRPFQICVLAREL